MTWLAIAGSLAGWLILVRIATGGPRLGRAVSRPDAAPLPPAEPPAVVGLVAGRPDADLFTVTLLDLAARGWFRLSRSLPDPRAPVPAMCVLPAEAPVEGLTPYEQRSVAHLSLRAGPLLEIPAAALADGFEGGEGPFHQGFRGDVVAAARRLGLTRPTLSTARKAVLCLFALVPAGVALGAAYSYQHSGQLLVFCAFYYAILCTSVARVSSERLTAKGQQALADWRAHSAIVGLAANGTRDEARAAALGANPEALAQFTAPEDDTAWSGYGAGWRLVTIGDPGARTWPGLSAGALAAFCLLTTPGIPLLAFLGYEVAGGSRGIELGILTGVALDALVVTRGVSRWAHLPRFAEFDGMVLRQWEVESSDEGTSYHVAVDDGFGPQAWAFEVRPADYHRLAPGTVAHVRINARLNKLIDIEATRPPARSPKIADPAQPADPP
ncbi:MAG TPA: hypothetical protein VMC83_12185 [Streptosporangiaceae bacterium]|nr:hypothetical protein [Streptosporangiaceae bacterium]